MPQYSVISERGAGAWVAVLAAELLGTMFLVIIGCGAALNFKTDFDITQVRVRAWWHHPRSLWPSAWRWPPSPPS